MKYHVEAFTDDEVQRLAPYVTNLDRPAFALRGVPEVLKGALFARYSRTHTSLRRLMLDEFLDDLPHTDVPVVGCAAGNAAALYRRVLVEYGDDSVAQLGSAHVACEQVSNVCTKILERGRLMSYLEQSTRYIAYDTPLGDQWRCYRPELAHLELEAQYDTAMHALFTEYAALLADVESHLSTTVPAPAGISSVAWRRTIRAQALDAVRGILPAATLSNVGIHGSGQAFEHLILRLRAHPLREAREYGELLLGELQQVIPSFLERLDRPERGGEWQRYLSDTRRCMEETAATLFCPDEPADADGVRLEYFDPDGEHRVLAAIAYEAGALSLSEARAQVNHLDAVQREALLSAYVGERTNRRHRPGRAFEATTYTFDVVCDYGAFRDLQRHRMCSIEWQPLTFTHGYGIPTLVEAAGRADRYGDVMENARAHHDALCDRLGPHEAAYLVPLGYRIRFALTANAREVMHIVELRTAPQGHPSYRALCQTMHDVVANVHPGLGAAMRFVDHSGGERGRADAESRHHRDPA